MASSLSWTSRRSLSDLLFTYCGWLLSSALFLLIRLYGTKDRIDWINGPLSIVVMLLLAAGVLATIDWIGNHWIDKSRLRSLPYWVLLLLKAFTFLLAILVIVALGRLMVLFNGSLSWADLPASYREHIRDPRIVAGGVFVVVSSVAIAFVRQSAAMIGARILRNLMFGRYRHPREEELIFMFLDMRDSTGLAERLGHRKFSLLLQDCFRDLTDAALRHQVEIYKYVGDEAILTWRPRDGLKDCNCLATYFAFVRILEERRAHYEETFQCFPSFKGGLNIGLVTVAEVGVLRREIAYLSDVLNTAARVQGKCNELESPLLITAALRDRLPEDHPFTLSSKGSLTLTGRKEKMELFRVSE